MEQLKWIRCTDELPANDEFGELFLCCIETPTNNEYQIAEWFNPVNDGGNSSHEASEEPEFIIKLSTYRRKVIAWARFNRYE